MTLGAFIEIIDPWVLSALKGQRIPLGEQFGVGRDGSWCQIHMRHNAPSLNNILRTRHTCMITPVDDGFEMLGVPPDGTRNGVPLRDRERLVDGDEIMIINPRKHDRHFVHMRHVASGIRFRFRTAEMDPLLGPTAWNGDTLLFAPSLPRLRTWRTVQFTDDGARVGGAAVVHRRAHFVHSILHDEVLALAKFAAIDGPTFGEIVERTVALGATVDADVIEAVASAVHDYAVSFDEVTITWAGDVVVISETPTQSTVAPGTHFREMLREANLTSRLTPPRVARPDAARLLAGVVRALFPDEAAAADALAEEVATIGVDEWRARGAR